MAIDLSSYNTVAERIAQFSAQYPEGSLQCEWQMLLVPTLVKNPDSTWTAQDRPIIVAKAFAYRTPDDPRPGIGHAQEPMPGKTPYTRDSEIQNAETSAWGRAIVAVLAADTRKGVASRDEVQARRGDQ
jgi:hypothetical protein